MVTTTTHPQPTPDGPALLATLLALRVRLQAYQNGGPRPSIFALERELSAALGVPAYGALSQNTEEKRNLCSCYKVDLKT